VQAHKILRGGGVVFVVVVMVLMLGVGVVFSLVSEGRDIIN
jgi:hypothetical protein